MVFILNVTKNYGLYVTNNEEDDCFDFIQKMGGDNNDSNMNKIDKALGEKAEHSVAIYATLLASAWAGIDSPFTQELFIDGIHEAAKQNGHIYVSQEATFEQRDIARCAMLQVIGQSEGKLVISADGEMPEQDIPVTIILFD